MPEGSRLSRKLEDLVHTVDQGRADPLIASPLITVVHTAGCHYCDDAQAALTDIAQDHPIRVEYVAASSPDGVRLLAAHRVGMFPLVLLDGQFFSAGRLPRAKLRQHLSQHQAGLYLAGGAG